MKPEDGRDARPLAAGATRRWVGTRGTSVGLGGVALLAVLAGCGMAQDRPAATLALAECRLPKLAVTARCGVLDVPEDRSRPEGRTIEIFVAVLPANAVAPKGDPLFVLAGGPGQAASELAPLALRLGEVRRTRDIVLLDQRGAGRSSPLRCAAFGPDDDIVSAFAADPVARARDCLREIAASEVDLRQYTTEAWVADVEAVRSALRYPQVNLWGGSYGSRVALAYLRRHPERVRSMVLDGVAPPQMAVPRDATVLRERALADVLAACEASAPCRTRHPDLGRALDRLERGFPISGRRIEFVDPRRGVPRELTLTFDRILGGLLALTYAPERAALLPEIVERAAAGDFAALFAAAQASAGGLAEQINQVLHYAVICNEDAPRVTPEERRELAALKSGPLVASTFEVCALWPQAASAADLAAPVSSDVPTLLLSGGLDPVTPPAGAAAVAATLANSRQVVVRGSGHIVSTYACVPRLIAEFVAAASVASVSGACIDFLAATERPPLWSDRLGPQL